MSLPQPPVELKNHCSVVFNNTLFVYSPSAFQSLELSEGAEWKTLKSGVAVEGAACVKAVPGGDPAQAVLYIVGGNSSSSDYPGLQRYSFSAKSWETITPEVTVTQNRQHHAAAYLNSSSSLLVYAGSQTTGDVGESSATFLISLVAPYGIQSFSSVAPPLVDPWLLPYDDSSALLVGGSADNKQLWKFSSEAGWQNLGTELDSAITNQDTTKCTVVSGDDGSKVLEKYNLGVSPNEVSRIVLQYANGSAAASGETIGDAVQKRDLTLSDWPTYNDTLAPTTIRSGFSIAQDSNGLAVISGGSSEDALCIFNERQNTWVNATKLLVGQDVLSDSTSSSTSSIASTATSASGTASASSAATSTTSSGALTTTTNNNKDRMVTVLGATLGTILGLAAIFILVLFLLKWKRDKRKRQGGDDIAEKDGRLSFADRGMEFMKETGGTVATYKSSDIEDAEPRSSLAIISGKFGGGHKRGQGSDASTAGLVKKKSPLAYNEPLEMSRLPEKSALDKELLGADSAAGAAAKNASTKSATSRSRSSGWSKYFANNEATNLAHMPSGRSTYASDRLSVNSGSHYTDSRIISRTVPPLDLGFTKFEGQRLSRVATGSPTLGHSREDLHSQPMQAELARANSTSSTVSSIGPERSYLHDAEEATANWTPVATHGWNHRAPSSHYTTSMFRDPETSFYDGASSYYPKSEYPGADKDDAFPLYPPGKINPPEGRESTVTVFPRGVPSISEPTNIGRREEGQHQDMSWLNLGANGNAF